MNLSWSFHEVMYACKSTSILATCMQDTLVAHQHKRLKVFIQVLADELELALRDSILFFQNRSPLLCCSLLLVHKPGLTVPACLALLGRDHPWNPQCHHCASQKLSWSGSQCCRRGLRGVSVEQIPSTFVRISPAPQNASMTDTRVLIWSTFHYQTSSSRQFK